MGKNMKKEIYYKITDAKTLQDEYDHLCSLELVDKTLCELRRNDQLLHTEREYIILKVLVKRYFDENEHFLREEMFTTKVLSHKEIQDVVDKRIESIFFDLQEMLGIKSGDILPEEQVELEQLCSQLAVEIAALVRKVIASQE